MRVCMCVCLYIYDGMARLILPPFLCYRVAGKLLADGWYAYARKMQYTGDIMMASAWGLACGFGSFMPYFYVVFFTSMIIHRQSRDEIRCREKYGEKDKAPRLLLLL